MLCPTVLPKLWGQFNLLPHALLGLVPILHVSSVLLSLSHLPVSRLDLASGIHPRGSELDWAHTALTTKFCLCNSKIQSQRAAATEFVCARGFLGLFPCLSPKSTMKKIFFSSVIPLALTFVPLLPAKCPIPVLISSPPQPVENLPSKDSLGLEISKTGMNFSSLSCFVRTQFCSHLSPRGAGLEGYNHRAISSQLFHRSAFGKDQQSPRK